MLTNIETIIRDYIQDVIHLSLATSKDNKPWVCEVHYAYDSDLNFYFISLPSTRHCTELRANKFISGNIVKQHQLKEKPRGVYFEGIAEQLENVDEQNPAFLAYHERFGFDAKGLEDLKGADGHRFYKITVSTFYVFDKIESEGEKYELKWKGSTA